MVLLGDIVGEDEAAVAAATSHVVRLANARSGEGFIAVNAEARRKFWLDRAKTAAIAKHTNAFKINEDVVIPLARLGEYTDAIERINIELSIRNKLELLSALEQYFSAAGGLLDSPDTEAPRRAEALDLLARVRVRWQHLLGNMDAPEGESGNLFDRLQDRSIRVSWKTEVRAALARIFLGSEFAPVLAECDAVHKRVLAGPGVRRPAHARRRRQCAHQHSGQFRQLCNAAHGEPRRGKDHADRPRAERRHFR